jgi:hypothetical protein
MKTKELIELFRVSSPEYKGNHQGEFSAALKRVKGKLEGYIKQKTGTNRWNIEAASYSISPPTIDLAGNSHNKMDDCIQFEFITTATKKYSILPADDMYIDNSVTLRRYLKIYRWHIYSK